MQRRGPRRRIMYQPRLDSGRPRLLVPQLELRQIDPAGILHRSDKIVTRRGLAVVPVKVQVGPGAERLCAQNRPHHANQFGALVIHRRGIEIGDFEIVVGSHRMRQRAAILGELRRSEQPHVVNPLDRFGTDIGRKTLVAEDRETFL